MKFKFRKSAVILLVAAICAALLAGCTGGKTSPSPTPSPAPSAVPSATASPAPNSDSIVYSNTQHGFVVTLPASWKGYSIVGGEWQGVSLKGDTNGKVVETGLIMSIRDPRWTAEKPRQDIPIMIFRLDQWSLMQKEDFHIGAAPIKPSELGRNNKYVFALPARYNFAFPEGYEEVEQILKGNPLKAVQIN